MVLGRGRVFELDAKVYIEPHTLRCLSLKGVYTDAHRYFVPMQTQRTALGRKPRIESAEGEKNGVHGCGFSLIAHITSRFRAMRCWPLSAWSVQPLRLVLCAMKTAHWATSAGCMRC